MELTRANQNYLHFDDINGHPLNGGRLCTYVAGTSTPIATYKTKDGIKNPVEIPLDSRGECNVWLDPTIKYKFVVKRADGSVVSNEDNVTASAHVPATIPFAVDEEHFKVEMLGNTAVLSLADSLVAKLKEKGVDID